MDCIGPHAVEQARGLVPGALRYYSRATVTSQMSGEYPDFTFFPRFLETVPSIFIIYCDRGKIKSINHSHPGIHPSASIARLAFFCFRLRVISTGILTVKIANTHGRPPDGEDPPQSRAVLIVLGGV